MATYYPDRSAKYAFLDIGYSAPPLSLTAAGIAALDAKTLATDGYEPLGYWAWFNETGTGEIIDQHVSKCTVNGNAQRLKETIYV